MGSYLSRNQRDSPERETNQQSREGSQEQEATQDNGCKVTIKDNRVRENSLHRMLNLAISRSFSYNRALNQIDALCSGIFLTQIKGGSVQLTHRGPLTLQQVGQRI